MAFLASSLGVADKLTLTRRQRAPKANGVAMGTRKSAAGSMRALHESSLSWIHENIVIIAFTNTHIGVRSSKHAHAMKNGMRHHTVQKVAGNMHKGSLWTSYKFFCRNLH